MKLEDFQVDDLHQIALNELEGHPKLIDSANKAYQEHTDRLVVLIHEAREMKERESA